MTPTPVRSSQILAGVFGAALALSACSSATPTNTSTPTTPQTGGSVTGGGTSAPAPPAGAKELDAQTTSGVQYARYSITGMTPQQVIADYEGAAKSAGYTVSNSGGGGGGWGGYGGASAGMTGTMTATYLDVQAGGESSGPTYFEVCVGPNESVVDQCDQNSQNASDSQSKGS